MCKNKLYKSFQQMLSQMQMLKKGIFGGKYFNKLVDNTWFQKEWFLDLEKSNFLSENENKKRNYVNVKEGQ